MGFIDTNEGWLRNLPVNELLTLSAVDSSSILYIRAQLKITPDNTALYYGDFEFENGDRLAFVSEISTEGTISNWIMQEEMHSADVPQVTNDGYFVVWFPSKYYAEDSHLEKLDWEGNVLFERALGPDERFKLAVDDRYFLANVDANLKVITAFDWNNDVINSFSSSINQITQAQMKLANDGDLLIYHQNSGIEKRDLYNGELNWSREFKVPSNMFSYLNFSKSLIVRDDGTYARRFIDMVVDVNGVAMELVKNDQGFYTISTNKSVNITPQITYEIMSPGDSTPKLIKEDAPTLRYDPDCIFVPDLEISETNCESGFEVVKAGALMPLDFTLTDELGIISITLHMLKADTDALTDPQINPYPYITRY